MILKSKIFSTKSVPKLFWSAPKPFSLKPPATSMAFLVLGLFLFGLGEALMVKAAVGVSPWTVLAQGVSNVTSWSIGLSTFVLSVAVLVCWIPLRQIPGIGTILNAVIIALVFVFVLPVLPRFEHLGLRVAQAVFGILLTGFGGALYLIANLGPGPRDGLMTGLQSVTNLPIAWVRSGIELSVIVLGWSFGGNVGLGTILFALGIGPAVSASMYGLQVKFGKQTIPDHH